MDTVKITIEIPEDFAEDAQEFGLLDTNAILQLLRSELDDRIMKFVDAEVKAYRAEKRGENRDQPE